MIILKPEPIATVTAGAENILTPSPKEIWVWAGGTLTIDLGAVRSIDTVFLGFTNSTSANAWRIQAGPTASPATVVYGPALMRTEAALSGRPHALAQFAPIDARYIDIFYSPAGALQIGVAMVGKSFQAAHERGGGRQLIDTGTKEQLPDGGLGGEDGVVLSALKWRFPGLSDAVRQQLWAIAYDRGERKPVLVVEEADTEATGAQERMHYGTFDRFEAYERRNPNDTTWALSMTEWL